MVTCISLCTLRNRQDDGPRLTSVQLPVSLIQPLYSSTTLLATSSSVILGWILPSGPRTIGWGTWFPPDMKKKKAVRKSIDERFGRCGGGAMNVPGGKPGGGVGAFGPAVVARGDRGDAGRAPAAPGAGGGGSASDMAPNTKTGYEE